MYDEEAEKSRKANKAFAKTEEEGCENDQRSGVSKPKERIRINQAFGFPACWVLASSGV
jgi:hypothetical protein